MRMSKLELYKTCKKLHDANLDLTLMIQHLEKQLRSNIVDSLSLSRSLYFILHNFEPKSAIMECDEEEGDIEIKKDKQELGVEIQ